MMTLEELPSTCTHASGRKNNDWAVSMLAEIGSVMVLGEELPSTCTHASGRKSNDWAVSMLAEIGSVEIER